MPTPHPPDPARPRSRGWIFVVLIVLLLGGGAAWWVSRRPAVPTDNAGSTAVSPEPTAVVAPMDFALPKDEHYQPPKVLTMRPVTYPEQALLNRVEGLVRVKFSLDETGHVTNVIVVRSSGSVQLDAMALEYDLRKWTFQPATLDGKPLPSSLEKEFEFRLDPQEQRALAEERLAAPIGLPDAPYPARALALDPKPQGTCTISVNWTATGRVDTINLTQSSGSNLLDGTALRFAFVHWRIDPKDGALDKPFTKTMTFTPPASPTDTPPPL